MTADGTASFVAKFNVRAFRSGPIRWLVVGGVFLIAAIAIATTIMAGIFRERALTNRERELENTVLLLARHFDQQLDDFTAIQRDLVAQIQSAGSSSEIFKGQLATLEWHEVLRTKVGAYSDIAGVNLFDERGTLVNSSEAWPVPEVSIADRAFFKAFKSGTANTPDSGRADTGPLFPGMGNRHRSSGDRTERRVSRGHHQGDCAGHLRKILCIRGARARCIDFPAPSRRHAAGALSAF